MEKVIIAVRGGVAEVEACPDGITVEIVDYDDLDSEQSVPPLVSCEDCEGVGLIEEEKCGTCWGSGLVSEQEHEE